MSSYEEAIWGAEAAAAWSPWALFVDAAVLAPTSPGVYMFRSDGRVIYVGVAGPRDGSGRKAPAVLRGRFAIYRGGRVTGFGQAVLDAALADPEFVRARLGELDAGVAGRSVDWVRAAFRFFNPEVRWAILNSKAEALEAENRLVQLLGPFDLLNRDAIRHRARVK